jgi:hypothetical protein
MDDADDWRLEYTSFRNTSGLSSYSENIHSTPSSQWHHNPAYVPSSNFYHSKPSSIRSKEQHFSQYEFIDITIQFTFRATTFFTTTRIHSHAEYYRLYFPTNLLLPMVLLAFWTRWERRRTLNKCCAYLLGIRFAISVTPFWSSFPAWVSHPQAWCSFRCLTISWTRTYR